MDLSEELRKAELLEELEAAKSDHDQVLHLNFHGLEELPEKLVQEAHEYQNVTRIYLKRNKLQTLPNSICKLPNLKELYIPGNDIAELPEGVGLLQNLESLDLSCNRLKNLPSSICRLQALERLHLSNNDISSLPQDIKKLHHLKVLEVMNNRLRHLPEALVECEALTRLLVDRNCIQWLPQALCNMTQLEELSAAGNKLLCLPMDLGDMKSLRCVYVDNNPFLHAVPLSVNSQELGFSSCGTANFESEDPNILECQSLDIECENTKKKIYLPREMTTKGDREGRSVPTLLELALREVHQHYKEAIQEGDLPQELYQRLQSPVAMCQCCRKPIFTMGYPMVFEGQVRLYQMYKLALCCSPWCVKVASLIIHLPLIYPNPTSLCMAVALFGN